MDGRHPGPREEPREQNPAYSPTRLPLFIFAGQRPCLLTKQTLGVESGANPGPKYRRFCLLPMRHIWTFWVSNVVQCRSVADISVPDALGSTCTGCLLLDPLWRNSRTDGAPCRVACPVRCGLVG